MDDEKEFQSALYESLKYDHEKELMESLKYDHEKELIEQDELEQALLASIQESLQPQPFANTTLALALALDDIKESSCPVSEEQDEFKLLLLQQQQPSASTAICQFKSHIRNAVLDHLLPEICDIIIEYVEEIGKWTYSSISIPRNTLVSSNVNQTTPTTTETDRHPPVQIHPWFGSFSRIKFKEHEWFKEEIRDLPPAYSDTK